MNRPIPEDLGHYIDDYVGIDTSTANKQQRISKFNKSASNIPKDPDAFSYSGYRKLPRVPEFSTLKEFIGPILYDFSGDIDSDDEMDLPVINSSKMEGWTPIIPKKRWRSSVTYEMPRAQFYDKYGKPGYRSDAQKAAYTNLLEGNGRYRYKRSRYYRPYRSYRRYGRRRYGYRRRGLYGLEGNGFYGRGRFNFGNWLKKAGRTVGHGLATASRFANRHAGDIALAADLVAPEYAGAVGEALALNKGLHKLTGRGAYSADDSSPSMNSMFTGGGVGMVGGVSENQDVTINHCEYLQDVYGPPSATFLNQAIALNPGLSYNIPWLAQIAANYEEYEFLQLVFEFRSTVDPSATNNSSGATGTIIMATNYNPDAPQFQAKQPMMDYHGAQSGRVTEDMIHGVECNPAMNAGTATKYVRTRNTAETLKDFDLGKFQFAIVNIPPAFYDQQIGELWVTYTVRLQKPRLYVSVGRQLPFDRVVMTANTVDGVVKPLLLEGLQATNILGVDVTGTVTQSTNDVDCETIVEFPNYMTGVFEVVITCLLTAGGAPYVTGTGRGFNIGFASSSVVPVVTQGSMELFPMYMSAEKPGTVENWVRDDYSYGVTGVNQSIQESITFRTCVIVTPVVNGTSGVTDNKVFMRYSFQNGASAANIDFNTAITVKPINNTLPWVFESPAGLKTNVPLK